MYLDFFSLRKFPFRITPDPSMFYPGRTDGPGVILNALVYAITSGEGIIKVVGEVGSGKTMLCRMLEERLPPAVKIVYLANPRLSARDIIYAIAFELHLDVDAGTERLLVMQKLQDYLLQKHSEGGSVVVFIEEAQGMPIETLEEIRLLSNLETHQHKLMQIVLFGQPELDKNLEDRSIRQLRERITHSFYLTPMSLEATRDYIRYRLQAAGCPWPQVFSPQAEKLLARAAGGLTRRINILADKSLMAAYADSAIQAGQEYGPLQQTVLPKHVRAAIRDSSYRGRVPAWLPGAAVVLVLALGIVFFWPRSDEALMPALSVPTEIPLQAESELPALPAAVPASMPPAADTPVQATAGETLVQADPAPEAPAPEAVVQAMTAPVPAEQETAVSEVSGLADESAPVDMAVAAVPAEPAVSVPVELPAVPAEDPPAEMATNLAVSALEAGAGPLVDTAAAAVSTAEPVIAEPAPLPAASVPAVSTAGAPAPEVDGLIALRSRASENWLQRPNLAAYTVQLAAFSLVDEQLLEEFLQQLTEANLLNQTYLCRISATADRPSQWLVFQGDFAGVTVARNHIESLPVYGRRYGPFVRNTSNISCL